MSEQHPSGPPYGAVPGAGPGAVPGAWPAVPPPAYGYHLRTPRPDPLPAPGTAYPQFWRTGRTRWWKGVVVIVLLV